MKEKILELLRENNGYVSGQEICDLFGVSRTAVWKNINALKNEGYMIDSVNNRGYKLIAEPDLIDEKSIRRYLHTNWLANTICYDKQMYSTNIKAKQLGETGAKNGTFVITDSQTKGRGRRGKTWVSPSGVNCYFTILLRPDLAAEKASMITLISALALARAIKDKGELETVIKWPNDIVANGKKLCGILTESSTDLEYINYVVVGIGVNMNQTEFPEEIRHIASSIQVETGRHVNRAELIGCFLDYFESYYEMFLKSGDLSALAGEYNALLVNRGKEVKIVEQNRERVMKAIGIDETGALMVENETGEKERIISGEVSVRGLYGYT